MSVNNEEINNLVQEGIDLSSEIIAGIYESKRRKKITILLSFIIVLCAVVIVLWKIDFTRIATVVLIAGICGLILIYIYAAKELRGLKRELDALNHYIRN